MKLILNKENNFNRKVSIIGSGFVGASIAYALMLKGIAREIILVDAKKTSSLGEVLDIKHGIPYMGSAKIISGDYSDTQNSDLIIITAGRNRRPNEDRLSLASDNIKIVQNVIENLTPFYTRGVIMIVTNPVDIITKKVIEWTKLPKGYVFGTGCLLDSSRFTAKLSDFLKINTEVITAHVIGEHGKTQIPLWSKVVISGMPIDEYCSLMNILFTNVEKEQIATEVREMGTKIISYKDKTHYGIATAVCYLADAILNGRSTIASVSSISDGEFGITDVAISIPSVVGANGVERIIVERIDEEEFTALRESADYLKEFLQRINGKEEGNGIY